MSRGTSFVPEAPTQELRALLRTRKQLVREQASHVQRLQKTLEDANLKVGSVLTQIMGVSGRAILQALIDGERDPDKLLTLVQRDVKAPPEKLRAALQGRVTVRHRFLLRLHLRQIDALDAAIAEIDAEVDRDLDPFRQAVRLLRTILGVSDLTAQVIVPEIGTDMSRFPTAGHLISWAGLCPRNDESAGKRRSTRLRQGAPWPKTTLVQCAWAASRKKLSYLQAQFQRLRHRADPRRQSAPSPPPSSPPPTTGAEGAARAADPRKRPAINGSRSRRCTVRRLLTHAGVTIAHDRRGSRGRRFYLSSGSHADFARSDTSRPDAPIGA